MENFTKILMVILILALSSCFSEEWTGYVYPDRSDLTQSIYIGKYNSLTACRDAALAKLDSISSSAKGDYECGLNCKGSICEKTEK